jgi:hypothetical protein
MKPKDRGQFKDRFVYVKDKEGKEFVCKVADLKTPDELTEEEKAACFDPPQWGQI